GAQDITAPSHSGADGLVRGRPPGRPFPVSGKIDPTHELRSLRDLRGPRAAPTPAETPAARRLEKLLSDYYRAPVNLTSTRVSDSTAAPFNVVGLYVHCLTASTAAF